MYRFVLRDPCRTAIQTSLRNHVRQHSSHNMPREAGFGKFIVIVAPFVAAGGAITYAKQDAEFRKTLVKNVPGAEAVLKVAIDSENPLKTITSKIESVTSTVTSVTTSVSDFVGQFTGEKKEEKPAATKPIEKSVFQTTAPAKPTPVKTEPKKATPVEVQTTKPAPAVVTPQAAPLPTEIGELEKAIELSASLAVQEYNKAIKILNNFNEEVRKVVDEAIEKSDTSSWVILKNKTSARDTAVSTAEHLAREAVEKIEKCEIALSHAVNASNHERIEAVRSKIKKLSEHLSAVKDELYRSKDTATISEKYWRNVETARNYFVDEIQSLFPGLNLAEKKLALAKDDLDLFLMHAYSHVLAYQKELQRLQTDGELRLKRAIEAVRGTDNSEAINSQLAYLLEKEKRAIVIENQKKIFQIRAAAEKELRQQLKRQSEAHIDHIQDAVAQKETELKRAFNRELDEKLSVEKAAYKLQLAAMVGKVKGMDAALKERAETERSAHQAQSLWAACQVLWSTVRTGEPGVNWRNKLRPLKNEIKAVSKAAAEGDELVSVVLQNIPSEALNRGVYPEDALRERFLTVEKVARKVALVPEQGASLPIYLLSYIQSAFILQPDEPVSKEELQNAKFDFSSLDTYDILNRARYFLDRGDLLQTVKYVNLLQGAPRKIASDWLKEARLLLETQQAANTLMSHAASSGILYL